jgi:hypothetical protein
MHCKERRSAGLVYGIVHSHKKTEKRFLTTRDVRCVHHGAMVVSTYFPPLLHDLADLKAPTNAAVNNIDASMVTRVWQELEYRNDVLRVTHGAHIEYL